MSAFMIGIPSAIRRELSGVGAMDQVATITALIVGAIVGWLVAGVLKRKGFRRISDIAVSMVGGVIGAFVWTFIYGSAGSIDFKMIAAAAVGGLVLLIVWRLARG
jgi:uncharacterized membrane protein YeaQ/YmgE (transglycosylase-associated protein family)